MRIITYLTLAIIAATILLDTYIGEPISKQQQMMVDSAIALIASKHLSPDESILRDVRSCGNFRQSWLLNHLAEKGRNGDSDFGFHAYTPVLSRTRIFLGEDFSCIGAKGRASVLVHEAQHLRRHRRRILRGIPRTADEAEAYTHQYYTYRKLGLRESSDSLVYWDMMLGVKQFVVPRNPRFAKLADIKKASRVLAGYY
jgi:hypothetical protein